MIATGVGVIAAIILWRAGALHSTPSMNTVDVLIPPGAVYFYYLQSRASRADARGDDVRHRNRDV
jgi:hypothetical protein